MFKLFFDKQFKKDLDKLDKVTKNRVLKKVFELEENPEIGKHLIGIDLWSLRIGKYRVLYKIISGQLQVLVLTIDHRKRVYKKF